MRRLVLVGGGHSHAAVLKRFGEDPVAGVELVLVNPGRRAAYSGMIPGLIAGDYEWRQCHIDLEKLSGFAGARFLDDRAADIDPDARRVALAGGDALEYALLSIDVGSTSAALAVPGVARHAVSVRPVERLIASLEDLRERSRRGEIARVAVVGAGAAGVELALSLPNCGDGRAVASWDGIALEGQWVWRWKDWIDRRFMARYRIPSRPGPLA